MENLTSGLHFLLSMSIAALLVFITVLIHYEAMRLTSALLPRLRIRPRLRILVVIFGIFLAHSISVWLFAIAYHFLSGHFGLGEFGGDAPKQIYDFVYFSAVTYASLGFGDVYPLQYLRLIAGVEALTGLVMIGWSASFTYLMMERFWSDHRRRKGGE